MPMYDYRCTECGKTYDIYHKTREVAEDVVCPACGSTAHKRLMSAASVSMGHSSSPSFDAPSCASGDCCGGACGLN
jgi:putative FmdB family regulatory protein